MKNENIDTGHYVSRRFRTAKIRNKIIKDKNICKKVRLLFRFLAFVKFSFYSSDFSKTTRVCGSVWFLCF